MTHEKLNPKGMQVDRSLDTPLRQSGNLRHGISSPDQQHFNKCPSCHFIKWLGQYITWVLMSGHKMKTNNSGHDDKTMHSALGKVEMRDGGADL